MGGTFLKKYKVLTYYGLRQSFYVQIRPLEEGGNRIYQKKKPINVGFWKNSGEFSCLWLVWKLIYNLFNLKFFLDYSVLENAKRGIVQEAFTPLKKLICTPQLEPQIRKSWVQHELSFFSRKKRVSHPLGSTLGISLPKAVLNFDCFFLPHFYYFKISPQTIWKFLRLILNLKGKPHFPNLKKPPTIKEKIWQTWFCLM